jgi:TyrR family helix-turn-helix protein
VDRGWLKEQLAAGRSIESIAREVDRDPSTVSYWAHKHGLVSSHAERHAARGGIERDVLENLVAEGLSIRRIADRLGLSYTTVRHWLRRYGLETRRAKRLRTPDVPGLEPLLQCPHHGFVPHVRGSDGFLRCRRCRSIAVMRRRARVREILIAEAGGRCLVCGYDGDHAALQFHHLVPATKAFTLRDGDTRSLARMREEASKCVLLCANCHAEVEAGLARLPLAADGTATGPLPR